MREGKVCLNCGKHRSVKQFFKSTSKFHSDGKIPICRKCIVDAVYDAENDCLNIDEFRNILRQIDKPFIPDLLDTAERQYEDGVSGKSNLNILPREGRDLCNTIIGFYFQKLNSLKQYNNQTYEDGELSENMTSKAKNQNRDEEMVYYLPDDDFVVTEDMIRLYGNGFTVSEYKLIDKYYKLNCKKYHNRAIDKNLLVNYAIYAAKEEIALREDNIKDAEICSRLMKNALSILEERSTEGNITCFSELFQSIEREHEVIPIPQEYKEQPQDIVDFIIWQFINYCRVLEGMPEVAYKDIYHFYDQKVLEYVKQYGDPYALYKHIREGAYE